jgi:hypothetical protein
MGPRLGIVESRLTSKLQFFQNSTLGECILSDCQNEPLPVPTNTPTPPTIIPSAGAPSKTPMSMPSNPHGAPSEFPMVMPSRHPWAPPVVPLVAPFPAPTVGPYENPRVRPSNPHGAPSNFPMVMPYRHPCPPAVHLVAQFPLSTVAPSLLPTVSNTTHRAKPIEALPSRVPLYRADPFSPTAVIPRATPSKAPSSLSEAMPIGAPTPHSNSVPTVARLRTASPSGPRSPRARLLRPRPPFQRHAHQGASS